jgi:hypothetical protein
MSSKLQGVVEGLVKPHAGGKETSEDKAVVVLSLKEFASGQKQRGIVLGIALLVLLVAPVVLILSSVPKEQLAYVLGGTGLFTAGTAKYLVDAMSEMSKAHALAIVCQGLESADAREVLNAWLKAKAKK